jgi:hypothetical protein
MDPMFFSPSTPAQMLQLSFRFGFMLAEAQMVIGLRLLGMAGLWNTVPSETTRMIREKLAASGEGAIAASKAVLQGKSPAKVADLALKPIRRRTKSNAARLVRRGPAKP